MNRMHQRLVTFGIGVLGTTALISSAWAAPVPAATTFKTSAALYPSTINPNFLPNGTLVRTAANPAVFYVRDGKRSWILPQIISAWVNEAHYFAPDVVTVISDEDMRRYPQTTSVNPFYIGKILKHPDGRQFFIDDRLQKRLITPAVRSALKYPSRNLYPTSVVHLNEFPTGTPITRTDVHPGGTVMYHGLYHGGTVWRIEQAADGTLKKRFYLQDYLYETEGYPWSSQILPVSSAELARYPRGSNIERYTDGWVVGLNGKRYVVQKGALRHIASSALFDAMGYKSQYVLTVYPEFLRRYPLGQPIAAFKSLTASVSSTALPPMTTTTNGTYPELRPAAREAITQVNDLFLVTYDRDITPEENRFWVDYVYKGEVQTKDELLTALRRAKSSGVRPAFTPRTTPLDPSLLRSRWFPYLFYFVWHKDPSDEDREYWYTRAVPGDRDTIEILGGAIQFVKDTTGLTRR